MKNVLKFVVICMCFFCIELFSKKITIISSAKTNDTIPNGVYFQEIDISGMTVSEAKIKIENSIKELQDIPIGLFSGKKQDVMVTAADLGINWSNESDVEEALKLGKSGNIVKRYKQQKDMEVDNFVYPIEFTIDREKTKKTIEELCGVYNLPSIEPSLSRENGEFIVVQGEDGQTVDVEASIEVIKDFVETKWDQKEASIDLAIVIEKPMQTGEDLVNVKDVLGTYSTSYKSSSKDRSGNVANACSKINGKIVYPGEEFSTVTLMIPFTKENGYKEAHSYSGGRVVESVGGGVCQVSSTLYNVVLLSELDITLRYNHAMVVGYVPLSADATVSEESNLDFKFVNNTGYPIYIEGVTSKDKIITITIYGVETRPSNRTIKFESQVISTTPALGEAIYTEGRKPFGYIDIQAPHTGYYAKLWKIVFEDGVEVSRTEMSSSKYRPAPRMATIGTANADAQTLAILGEAIATGSIDHTRNILTQLVTGTYVPPVQETVAPVQEEQIPQEQIPQEQVPQEQVPQ